MTRFIGPYVARFFAGRILITDKGFASMSSPTKHLETLTLSKQLAHGGNPVLARIGADRAQSLPH